MGLPPLNGASASSEWKGIAPIRDSNGTMALSKPIGASGLKKGCFVRSDVRGGDNIGQNPRVRRPYNAALGLAIPALT
jgi:hypothetical protein